MIDKNELAKTMGEENHMKSQSFTAPMVSINGNTGAFKKLCVDEKTGKYIKPAVDNGKSIEGVIIAIRIQVGEYNKQYSRSSGEVDSLSEVTSLWERDNASGKGQKIMVGTPAELRTKYATLKSYRFLYMMVGSDVIKFKIKGSAFTNFFDYLKKLSDEGKHTFDVVTRIDTDMLVNESLGTNYYVPKFTIAREVPDDKLEEVVAPKLNELRAKFNSMKRTQEMPEDADETSQAGFHRPSGESALEREAKEEFPTIDIDADSEEELNNLPF